MLRIEDLGAARVDGPPIGGSENRGVLVVSLQPRVAKRGQVNRCPALPSRLAWFGVSQEEPTIASARVKSASRGEVSTEIKPCTRALTGRGAGFADSGFLTIRRPTETGTTETHSEPDG